MPRLSIVIPSRSRPDLLRACLESVARFAPPMTEVLVVDDGSPDGVVSATARSLGVGVLRLASPGGFCVAVNCGIANVHGDIVETLNDDTEVTAGWAEAALRWFDDPHVGAVAPLVLAWPGENVDSAGDRYFLGGYARKRGHDELPSTDHLRPGRVFGASASSAFYRRDALRHVGGFPEGFGAYFEDVDLAFRLHRAGYGVQFEPGSRVLHHGGASHGNPAGPLLEQQSRNEELVFWRNVPAREMWRAVPLHLATLAGKAWLRWREGNLREFVRGRLRAFAEFQALAQHRRQLRRLGPDAPLRRWLVATRAMPP